MRTYSGQVATAITTAHRMASRKGLRTRKAASRMRPENKTWTNGA
jgi:hypothetical protein